MSRSEVYLLKLKPEEREIIYERVRKEYRKYKRSLRCVQCGQKHHLTFHHINPAKKKFDISTAVHRGGYTWSQIHREIKKCEPRCSKCHTLVHKRGKGAAGRKRGDALLRGNIQTES